jgi:site-specific DNA recombinase
MWEAQELNTRAYRAMRKTVEERMSAIQQKLIVRPAAEVLSGFGGPRCTCKLEQIGGEEGI